MDIKDIETKKQLLTAVAIIKQLQDKLKDNDVNIETIDTTIKELQSELDKTNKELSSSLNNEINTLNTSLKELQSQFNNDSKLKSKDLVSYSQKQESVLNGLKQALNDVSNKLNDYATKEDITQIDNRISVEVSDLTNKINKIPKPTKVDLSSYAKLKDIPKEIVKTEVIEKTTIEKPIEVTPIIEVGEVTTLDPGNKANVYISKKDDKYKLDFEIPRGVTGGHGRQGQDGTIGADGKDGLTTSVNNITQVNGNVSLTTDDIPETTTNMYVPTLPTETPQAKYLNGNKEWQEISVGSGGYSANLYFTTIDSDITGYKKINYVAEATETELTIPCTTVEVLARTYLYDYGIDTTVIDAGRWVATYRAKVSSTKGVTIRFEAFLRHIDNTETTLFSDSSDLIINTTYATLKNEVTQPIFNCVATDRLGVRIYASTTHPAGVTLNTIIGDGNGSYFTTPLSIRHNQLRDLNGDNDYLHITSTDITRLANTSGLNTGDQDISGKEDISNKSTNLVADRASSVKYPTTKETFDKIGTYASTVSGEELELTESNGNDLYDLEFTCKSEQDGTPTPDSPIDILSSGDGGTITIDNGTTEYPITLPTGYVGGSLPNGVADTDTQKKIGKVVLNGSEGKTWAVLVGTGYHLFADTFAGFKPNTNSTDKPVWADKFKALSRNEVNLINQEGITGRSLGGIVIILNDNRSVTTSAQFNTWLSTNNVTVYYELATPIDVSIDTEGVETSTGDSTITTTDTIKPELTATYLKKLSDTEKRTIGQIIYRATCDTAAATADKVITIADYVPQTGDMLCVRYTLGTSVASPKLNINGTGGVAIKLGSTLASALTHTVGANGEIKYCYDGIEWQMFGSMRTSDSDTIHAVFHNANKVIGAELTQFKIIFESTDGKFYPLSVGNTTAITKVQSDKPYRIGGLILWYNTTPTIAAGSTTTNTYSEHSFSTINYTLNKLTGFTSYAPIYLIGSLDVNGDFVLDQTDATSWFTQDLPSTEDGKLYLRLGFNYATTGTIHLEGTHPIYEYKNGKIQLYGASGGDNLPVVDTYADLADLDSGITKAIVKTDTLADRTYTTLNGSTQYEALYVNPLPPLYGETYEDTYFLSTGAGGTGTIQGQVEASEDDGFRLWTLQLSGIYLGAVALAIQQNYIGGDFEISFNGKTNIRLGGGWIDNLAYVDIATDEVLDVTMYDKKPDTISSFLTCYITPQSNDAANWHRIKYALQPTPFEINYSGIYEKIDDEWTLVVKNDKFINGNIGLPLPS